MTETQINDYLSYSEAVKEAVIPGYNSDWATPGGPQPVVPPNDEIWYTTLDNEIIQLNNSYASSYYLSANIIDHSYDGSKGIIKFDKDITSLKGFSHTGYNEISVFNKSNKITSIAIPNSVTSIGPSFFAELTSLLSIYLGNNINIIKDYCFYKCSGLTSITIPNSVTSIGNYAFDRCSFLTSITIPNSVTSIGGGAFDGCSSLTSPIYNAHLFAYMPTSYSGAYTIPDGIESIASYAFYHCSGLTSVTIPNSVTSIGEYAFYHCSGLTSVTIPNSVTSIGGGAFYYCSGLTSINVDSNNQVYDSRNNCNAIIKTSSNELICGCQSTIIPDSVTSIGSSAFNGCSGLTSITIPDSVTSIGSSVFNGCSGLTSVICQATTPPTLSYTVFPNNITDIYVPAQSVDAYKSTSNWSAYSSKIKAIQ